MNEDILPIIVREIEKHFDFLFEKGFKIESKMYYPQAFGDWEIVLTASCQIKIGTERGHVMLGFIPIAKHSNFAFGIETAIYFLSHGREFIGEYKGNVFNDREKQLERYANFLKNYLDQILPLFGENHEKYREDLLTAQQKVNELIREVSRERNEELIRTAEARRNALKGSLKQQKPKS